ncbi:MAG: hypothetical protein ACRBI6_19675 [Acidimicrobiales bacterium]
MHALKIGTSLTLASTATVALVFATFVAALISNESKRIPGVVNVQVLADSTEASVGITWHLGLAAVFAAVALAVMVASSLAQRSER